MKKLFALITFIGFALVLLAGSSIDAATSSDLLRLLALGALGGVIAFFGLIGYNSYERK